MAQSFCLKFPEGNVPATTDQVLRYALISALGRVEERPTFTEGRQSILLYPLDAAEVLERFLKQVYRKIVLTDNRRPCSFMEPTYLCPGCGFLIRGEQTLCSHVTVVHSRLARTDICYKFASSMVRLCEQLQYRSDPHNRKRIYLDPGTYEHSGAQKAVKELSGNATDWVMQLVSQRPALLCCPFCSKVFPNTAEVAIHIRHRWITGQTACSKSGTISGQIAIHRLNFIFVRQLSLGSSGATAKWLGAITRWANVVRTYILKKAAFQMSWTKFWVGAWRSDALSPDLVSSVYSLLSKRPLYCLVL